MNRETIERLAIDQASGQLSQDVAGLFHAYLTDHAEEKAWADDITETFDMTQQAIAQKTGPALVEETVSFPTPPQKKPIFRIRSLGRVAVFALALAIGFSVGRLDRSVPSAQPFHEDPASKAESHTVRTHETPTVVNMKERYASTFWGNKMISVLESKPVKVASKDRFHTSFWKGNRHE